MHESAELVHSLIKLLDAAANNGQTELQLSLLTLAQTLAHLHQQRDDTVSYVDMLQLGDALAKVQQLAHRILEEGGRRISSLYGVSLGASGFRTISSSGELRRAGGAVLTGNA